MKKDDLIWPSFDQKLDLHDNDKLKQNRLWFRQQLAERKTTAKQLIPNNNGTELQLPQSISLKEYAHSFHIMRTTALSKPKLRCNITNQMHYEYKETRHNLKQQVHDDKH